MGVVLTVRVHECAHELFFVESGGVDVGDDREVVRAGPPEWHVCGSETRKKVESLRETQEPRKR